MKNFNGYLMATLIFMVTQTGYAENHKFLRGCSKVGFKFENSLVVLEPRILDGRQTIYLIHNTSSNPIDLELDSNSESTDLFYKNQIGGQQWGAFAMDEKQLAFTCKSSGKSNMNIDCKKVLEICQFKDTKFPAGNQGDYWAIASQPLEKTRKDIISQGILLRWGVSQ